MPCGGLQAGAHLGSAVVSAMTNTCSSSSSPFKTSTQLCQI